MNATHAADDRCRTGAGPSPSLICALGGEGGGVLTEWLVETARQAGYAAQSTSIPGVAQRTGATTYYVEVFPVPLARTRRAAAGVQPEPGARRARRCWCRRSCWKPRARSATAWRRPSARMVITSPAAPDDGRADAAWATAAPIADACWRSCAAFSREHQVFDMARHRARGRHGRQRGDARRDRRQRPACRSRAKPCERVVRRRRQRAGRQRWRRQPARLRPGVRARAARCAAQRARWSTRRWPAVIDAGRRAAPRLRGRRGARAAGPARRRCTTSPRSAMRAWSTTRTRLCRSSTSSAWSGCSPPSAPPIRRARTASRPRARWRAGWRCGWPSTTSCAWPTSRAAQHALERVRGEVKRRRRRPAQGLRPLQARRARVRGAAAARLAAAPDALGPAPHARGRALGAAAEGRHAIRVFGMLALRLLAGLRWLRRRGSRYADEQALIERWLAGVVHGTRDRLGPRPRDRAVRPADQGLRQPPTSAARTTCCTCSTTWRRRLRAAMPADAPSDPRGARGRAGRRSRHGARRSAAQPRRPAPAGEGAAGPLGPARPGGPAGGARAPRPDRVNAGNAGFSLIARSSVEQDRHPAGSGASV